MYDGAPLLCACLLFDDFFCQHIRGTPHTEPHCALIYLESNIGGNTAELHQRESARRSARRQQFSERHKIAEGWATSAVEAVAAVAASADLPVAGAVSVEMADQDVVIHLTVEVAAAVVTVAGEVVWAAVVADTTVADDSKTTTHRAMHKRAMQR